MNYIDLLKNNQTSIRKIASVVGCSYGNLLKASKQPVPGKPYDPTEINFEQLEKAIRNKLQDSYDEFDWELCITESAHNNEGQTISTDVGDHIQFKRGHGKNDPDATYTVVFKTETHVVLESNKSTEPRVIALGTLKLFGAYNVTEHEMSEVDEGLTMESVTKVPKHRSTKSKSV